MATNSKFQMPVSIYALGGLGEVGKNMYVVEDEKTILLLTRAFYSPNKIYQVLTMLFLILHTCATMLARYEHFLSHMVTKTILAPFLF